MSALAGMKILVVGARGTLGGAFADAAAAAGATIVIAGREPVASALRYLHLDVTDAASCDAVAEQLESEGGALDVLFNFSGTHHPVMNLAQGSARAFADEFERVVDVNLRGAFHLTAAFAPMLARQRAGHIVHLCSNASRVSLEGSHAYVASKHGLEGLIRSSAAQLARFGVRVNGLAPGTVETRLNQALLRDADGRPSARAASILAHTPTKRFATVDGVVESAIALCLPQRHLTGNVVFCDDGYVIEGHSWPEGNRALYTGAEALASLLDDPTGTARDAAPPKKRTP